MMSNNSNKELAPPVFMRHMQHQRDPLPGIGGGGGGGLHPQHLSTPSPGFGGGSPTSMSSNGAQHLLPLGQDVSASVSGGGGGDVTPHKALEESPMAVVGSLAVARRRARNQANAGGSSTSSLGASPEHNAAGGGTATHVHRGGNFSDGGDMSPHRSPSPPEAGTPTAEASHSSVQQQLNMHDDGLSSTHYQQINHGPSKKTLNALLDVLDPDTDGSTIVDMLPRHNSGGVQQMHYQQQQQQQQQQPPSGPSTHFQRGSFQ